MSGDWSREEVEATVAVYFEMLDRELRGDAYNKAEYNRRLQRTLNNRSKQAIEYKHANISAALNEIGYPSIDGYKRRSNYQAILRAAVLARVEADHALEVSIAAAVLAPVISPPPVARWHEIIEDPPKAEKRRPELYERLKEKRAALPRVNYLEREARNRALGLAGEEFVLRAEAERLRSVGRRDLANRIEHVAATKGDGLGYDVLSFDNSGKERLIEVKTTRFGSTTPFFASANEVIASEELAEYYHLYRVFRFDARPKLFVLPGALRSSVELTPAVYRAVVR